METYHLLHLAVSWPTHMARPISKSPPPISSRPASLSISEPELPSHQAHQHAPSDVAQTATDGHVLVPQPVMRAAAAQMVFAARGSRDFITPEHVEALEDWCARAMLEALTSFKIDLEVRALPAGQPEFDVLISNTFSDCSRKLVAFGS